MKKNNRDRTLESFKVFPYVAWVLTLGFAFFVYQITTDLKEITLELQQQTKDLQEKVNTPVDEISDFNS